MIQVHLVDDVLCRQVHDEAVLLDLQSQRYFGLDAVGARVWSLLAADPRVDRALEVLGEEFDVAPERLERDVEGFLRLLVEHGLARLESSTGAPEGGAIAGA